MAFSFSMQCTKALLLALLVIACILSGCSILPFQSEQATSGPISLTVGGKLDPEAHLLSEMYILLLQQAGFHVIDKSRTGKDDIVFQAITSGAIDLYPEFTTTGLTRLHLTPTGDPNQDYQTAKQGYEKNYHVTWLDMSPSLNDTYGICIPKSRASEMHITTISNLIQYAPKFTIAGSDDGLHNVAALPALERAYGITFNQEVTITKEEQTYQEAIDGRAQLNVCYTTSPLISQYNFMLLDDDKQVIPAYYPAPIVRDGTLRKAPQIAAILNRLAPKLTSEISRMLQGQVAAGFSVPDVAQNWLQSQGLL